MIWCVYAAVHSWAAWKSIKCWQDVAGCLAEPRLQWAGAEILNPHLHICKPHLSHVYIIIMNWNYYVYIADIADYCGCLTGCDFSYKTRYIRTNTILNRWLTSSMCFVRALPNRRSSRASKTSAATRGKKNSDSAPSATRGLSHRTAEDYWLSLRF